MLRWRSALRNLCRTTSLALSQRSTKTHPCNPLVPGDERSAVPPARQPWTDGPASTASAHPGLFPSQEKRQSLDLQQFKLHSSGDHESGDLQLNLHMHKSQNKLVLPDLFAAGYQPHIGKKTEETEISVEGECNALRKNWLVCTLWYPSLSPAQQLQISHAP